MYARTEVHGISLLFTNIDMVPNRESDVIVYAATDNPEVFDTVINRTIAMINELFDGAFYRGYTPPFNSPKDENKFFSGKEVHSFVQRLHRFDDADDICVVTFGIDDTITILTKYLLAKAKVILSGVESNEYKQSGIIRVVDSFNSVSPTTFRLDCIVSDDLSGMEVTMPVTKKQFSVKF